MDWIRRNWPDLLIGMGLLAVIAGIVATLLTGGDFFPLGARDRPPLPPASRAADPRPPVPGQGALSIDTPTDTSPAVTPLSSGTPVAIPNLPSIAQPASNTDAGAGVQPQEAPTVVALRPGDTASQPSVTDSASAAQNPLQPAAPAVEPAAAAPVAVAPAAPATAPAAVASPSAGTSPAEDPEAPYRVSVGSFLSAENAQRQAELFRQAGYPVFLASQGELSLVLLGPYRLETEAERVRTAVANGGFDVAPIIYTFKPDGASTTVAPAAQAPTAAAPQPQPRTAPVISPAPAVAAPTASAAGRYLQAGAYSSEENAQLQRSAIEALGFRVTVQLEGNLLRVLVGPYGDNDLSAAQSSLARQGIDSIPR